MRIRIVGTLGIFTAWWLFIAVVTAMAGEWTASFVFFGLTALGYAAFYKFGIRYYFPIQK